MFYTPNKEDYVVNINLLPGMGQEIVYGEADFELSVLRKQTLTQCTHEYFPMVISINYQHQGANNAFIAYFTFNSDQKNRPTGVKNIKQLVIINSLPFEIKSIYGLNAKSNDSGAAPIKGQAEDEQSKECTICMSVDSDCIIMPCGHMCCCMPCGKILQKSEQNICPVCRGPISTLVPLKR